MASLLLVFKIICCLGTIVTGFISLIGPKSIKDFTGLEATGPRGITEIRAVLGALFIGAGLAPLMLGTAAYQMLGIIYLAIALVRAVSMFVDKSVVRSNLISLAVEIVFGVILVL
jgi:Domain of unknown function (DUF4345)